MSDLEIYQKVQTGDFVVPIKDACIRGGVYADAFPIGFSDFDEAMRVKTDTVSGGVRDGDLIIITGKPGEGKTTFAQNIALNFNKNAFPSLFFSYEVIPDNIYNKFKEMGFSDEYGCIFAPKKIITGNLKWIEEKIIEAKEKYMVKMIFIDHIDFLMPTDQKNSDQVRTRLKQIALELKSIALKESVIIFLIAHVKKVEGREIEMTDIAESSGMAQLADFAFSVSRAKSDSEDGVVYGNEGKIKMMKNRLTGKLPYIKFTVKENIIYKLYDQGR